MKLISLLFRDQVAARDLPDTPQPVLLPLLGRLRVRHALAGSRLGELRESAAESSSVVLALN